MNVEQLLPWLAQSTSTSTSTPLASSPTATPTLPPKIYSCQRCINHGITVARKNHKWQCAYATCMCELCVLVEKRRLLNAELARAQSMDSGSSTSSPPAQVAPPMPVESPNGNKERLPHCQRCAQHNVINRLKGHKRVCPFRDCPCIKCQVVVERQRLMADQIKLRRRQKKQKVGLGILKSSDTPLPTTPTTPIPSASQGPADLPPSSSSSPASSSDYSIHALINSSNNEQPKFPLTLNPMPMPFQLPFFNNFNSIMSHAPVAPMPIFPGPFDWQLAFAIFQQNQAAMKNAQ
uniref:DM domain-containing protein n=1 Tax=Panagrellus redivivus TaxID=6233 RepID=A0A7E4VR91_PANRE